MARVLDEVASSAARAWSWSAVLKGSFAGLAVYVVLRYLGAAFGASTGDGVLAEGFAVWTVAAQVAAIFVGGMVTGFVLGSFRPLDGALAGTFTWAVAIVLMTALLGSPGLQVAEPALWGAFAGAVLSLSAGIAGGILGVQRSRTAMRPGPTSIPNSSDRFG
ncbi:hypothetical protein [Chondromyces crocatus]|uniref:Uncharacterized protein n=1 Tax=Chondromyces crocatus TaxID=52 RepID=A0A0K1E9J6_CHOCO|nr:hypothetical protein [Chondromyces crocatus]AKT37352.1 uncharacterized protein CMC5_014870 [Chondromyces crocatus]